MSQPFRLENDIESPTTKGVALGSGLSVLRTEKTAVLRRRFDVDCEFPELLLYLRQTR